VKVNEKEGAHEPSEKDKINISQTHWTKLHPERHNLRKRVWETARPRVMREGRRSKPKKMINKDEPNGSPIREGKLKRRERNQTQKTKEKRQEEE